MSKLPKKTATFEYTNPHPNGKHIGDCVIRAISVATGKEWLKVYAELCELGREYLETPTGVFKEYLDKIGTRLPSVIKNKKRITPRQLAKLKDGNTYVVRVANHLVTVKDGKVRDTWDSGEKSSYIIWQIN